MGSWISSRWIKCSDETLELETLLLKPCKEDMAGSEFRKLLERLSGRRGVAMLQATRTITTPTCAPKKRFKELIASNSRDARDITRVRSSWQLSELQRDERRSRREAAAVALPL